jgi:redox-sensitive bicupin YhaK (pirin superfamily)
MLKSIFQKSDLQFKKAFPGLIGVDIMAHSYPIEPILVFTEFHMQQAVFGPHPHAGISVMTYMLLDSEQGFINRDSLGDFSYIEPGGLHVSQAGSGMFHDEFPKESGVDTHGFQIWINHQEKDRFISPKSIHVAAKDVKIVENESYLARIILGNFQENYTDYELVTNVNILHIFLKPNHQIQLPAKEMAFVYGLNGNATIDSENTKAQSLVNFSKEGDEILVTASDLGFEFLFCTATPINEPIVYGGPFVMTTSEQMQTTRQRLTKGDMGDLKPYQP